MQKRLRLTCFCGLLVTLFLATVPVDAQQKPSLQTLFDSPAPSAARGVAKASGDVIIVDIEEFQDTYTSSLTISNGLRYRFINGTLRCGGSFGGPLLRIDKGSEVELAETATLSGSSNKSDQPLVRVANGSFDVTGGTIEDIYGWGGSTPTFGQVAVGLVGG